MIRCWLVVVAVALLGACGTSGKPPAPSPKAEQPFSLAGVFPAGPGRELVLETCGSCHPVACCALGQRTAERWEAVQEGHKDKLTGRSSADVNAMFAYLKENFNNTKPEPKIPAELAQQGCTPY